MTDGKYTNQTMFQIGKFLLMALMNCAHNAAYRAVNICCVVVSGPADLLHPPPPPPYLRVCCSCVCVGASGFPQVHFMLNDDVNTKTMQLAGEQSTEDRKKRTEIVSICLEILWIFGLVCHSAVFYWNSYEECTSETISTNVERYESMQIYFCWWVLVLMVQSHNFVENLYAHQLLVYRCQRYFIGSFGIQLDFMLSRKL